MKSIGFNLIDKNRLTLFILERFLLARFSPPGPKVLQRTIHRARGDVLTRYPSCPGQIGRTRPAPRRRFVSYFLVAALAFTFYPTAPAKAGFFEDLFGSLGAVFDPAAQPQRQAPAPSTRKVRKRSSAKPKLTIVEKRRRTGAPQPLPGLMEDPSLQMGDAVVTKGGVRIFTGSTGTHHRPQDFVSLGDVRGLPKRTRTALAEIDANRARPDRLALSKADLVTGRSAAELPLETGTLIKDARGRTLRYVGP